ncbi:MAG TPA: radical SAM protein [Methanotrichaceae archaeon]|nr:radical SAM protein [Methanotrichaceae archaeon]
MNGLENYTLEGILSAREIDVAHIDHKLSYGENKASIEKQFGHISKVDDMRRFEKCEALAEENAIAPFKGSVTPIKVPKLPFDPIQRSKDVESVVMQGDKRRYYRFRNTEYYEGCVTADASGCNLLCGYCWNVQKNSNIGECNDKFRDPEEVATKINALRKKHGSKRYRISGCEAFLGDLSAKHLGQVIEVTGKGAMLETNGIMLGHSPELLEHIPKKTIIRLTLKGDSPESFEKVTGAKASAFKYQLKGLKALADDDRPIILAIMKQFIDIEKIGRLIEANKIDLAGKDFNVDFESLLYYPQNTKSMRDRGIKPQYTAKEFDKRLEEVV